MRGGRFVVEAFWRGMDGWMDGEREGGSREEEWQGKKGGKDR